MYKKSISILAFTFVFQAFTFVPFSQAAETPLRESITSSAPSLGGSLTSSTNIEKSAESIPAAPKTGALMSGPSSPNVMGAGESPEAYRAMIHNTEAKMVGMKANIEKKKKEITLKVQEIDLLNTMQKTLKKDSEKAENSKRLLQAMKDHTQMKKDLETYKTAVQMMTESNAKAEARLRAGGHAIR